MPLLSVSTNLAAFVPISHISGQIIQLERPIIALIQMLRKRRASACVPPPSLRKVREPINQSPVDRLDPQGFSLIRLQFELVACNVSSESKRRRNYQARGWCISRPKRSTPLAPLTPKSRATLSQSSILSRLD